MTIDVKGGNRHALRLMIGQATRQTSRPTCETVFLHWAKRIPTVIDASELKVGDRIIVRVRADRGATLQLRSRRRRPSASPHREPKAQESNQSAQS